MKWSCQLSRVHVAEDHTTTENGAQFNFRVRNGIGWDPRPMAGKLQISPQLLTHKLIAQQTQSQELADLFSLEQECACLKYARIFHSGLWGCSLGRNDDGLQSVIDGFTDQNVG